MKDTTMLRPAKSPYELVVVPNGPLVREAQRLRWRVFADELGARLASPEPGIDADRWDPWCDHLLVREVSSGQVVGTYRLLPAARRCQAGGFYAETEFALHGLETLGAGVVELGRACIAPEHRNGVTVALLWAGVLQYLKQAGHTHAIGCASLPASSEPERAATLCHRLLQDAGEPGPLRAVPHRAFDLGARDEGRPAAALPALLKGYLRLGARPCGPPAWDPDFGTADLLLHLPLQRLSSRHANRLLRAA